MIPGFVKSNLESPAARHRCDVSSELCFPGAKPRIWAHHLLHVSASYDEFNDGMMNVICYWKRARSRSEYLSVFHDFDDEDVSEILSTEYAVGQPVPPFLFFDFACAVVQTNHSGAICSVIIEFKLCRNA